MRLAVPDSTAVVDSQTAATIRGGQLHVQGSTGMGTGDRVATSK
jgi:hypothetical protein